MFECRLLKRNTSQGMHPKYDAFIYFKTFKIRQFGKNVFTQCIRLNIKWLNKTFKRNVYRIAVITVKLI